MTIRPQIVARIVSHARRRLPAATDWDSLFFWAPNGLLSVTYLPTGESVSLAEMRACLDRLERRAA